MNYRSRQQIILMDIPSSQNISRLLGRTSYEGRAQIPHDGEHVKFQEQIKSWLNLTFTVNRNNFVTR